MKGFAQGFCCQARRAPERVRGHTYVCARANDKRNAAWRQKDKQKGAIAQLGERLPCTQEVGSSILPGSTISVVS